MGPNTTTGRSSVILSTGCEINFALRVLHPILRLLYPSRIWSALPYPFARLLSPAPNSVAVMPAAEQADNHWIQTAASKLVWATGCTSWYVDARTARNTMLYPDWQFRFWARSVSVPLSRYFVFGGSPVQLPVKKDLEKTDNQDGSVTRLCSGLVVGAGVAVAAGLMAHSSQSGDAATALNEAADRAVKVV